MEEAFINNMKLFFSQNMTLANCSFFSHKDLFLLRRQIYRERKTQRKVFLLTACMFVWVSHVGDRAPGCTYTVSCGLPHYPLKEAGARKEART